MHYSAATDLVNHLKLERHPEGGYFRETYRSGLTLITPDGKERSVSTVIYYLLEGKDKSHFHRLASDEHWFHHLGQALQLFYIQDGMLETVTLGNNLAAGELLSFVVPGNTWFGCRVAGSEGFGLVSCVVSPGFDFEDFEMASQEKLTAEYPHLGGVIEEFTKK
jgi:uncharacterized protein